MERAVQTRTERFAHNSAPFPFKVQNSNCISCCLSPRTWRAVADRAAPAPTPAPVPATAPAGTGTRRAEARRERTRRDAPQERTRRGDEHVAHRERLRAWRREDCCKGTGHRSGRDGQASDRVSRGLWENPVVIVRRVSDRSCGGSAKASERVVGGIATKERWASAGGLRGQLSRSTAERPRRVGASGAGLQRTRRM